MRRTQARCFNLEEDAPRELPSGAAASVTVWANWYDTAGPAAAAVNVDGDVRHYRLRREPPCGRCGRLVGRARHASLAFNPDDAGTAHIAVASAVPIAADGRPIAVVVFEALKRRPAAPSVPVPPHRGLTANIRQRADAQCGRERCRPLAPLGTRTAMEIAA